MPLGQTHKYNPNFFSPPAPPYPRITYLLMTAFVLQGYSLLILIRFQLIFKVEVWGGAHWDCAGTFLHFSDLLDSEL